MTPAELEDFRAWAMASLPHHDRLKALAILCHVADLTRRLSLADAVVEAVRGWQRGEPFGVQTALEALAAHDAARKAAT